MSLFHILQLLLLFLIFNSINFFLLSAAVIITINIFVTKGISYMFWWFAFFVCVINKIKMYRTIFVFFLIKYKNIKIKCMPTVGKNYETHSFFNCLSSLPYQNTSSYKFIMCTNTHTFNCNINNLLLYYTAYFSI